MLGKLRKCAVILVAVFLPFVFFVLSQIGMKYFVLVVTVSISLVFIVFINVSVKMQKCSVTMYPLCYIC